jgi:fatty acid amide hydrolase
LAVILVKTKGKLPPYAATSVSEYHAVIAYRDKLRDCFMRAWRDADLDVVLCPAWAFPAPLVQDVRLATWAVKTTQVFNILDLPAGVVPVTTVSNADLAVVPAYDPQTDDAALAEAARRSVEGSEGLPVCVQVVGLPWREEQVLRAMQEIETGIGAAVGGSIELANRHSQLQPVPRTTLELGGQPVDKSEANAQSRL